MRVIYSYKCETRKEWESIGVILRLNGWNWQNAWNEKFHNCYGFPLYLNFKTNKRLGFDDKHLFEEPHADDTKYILITDIDLLTNIIVGKFEIPDFTF